jgi:hypothetical protein
MNLKLLLKVKVEDMLSNSFHEASVALIAKPHKDTAEKTKL